MKPAEIPTDVVYVGREILGQLSQAESREFLLTNGIGGYSSLTLAASLTRSYHGLLIAALRPPLDRTLLLSKLNDAVSYLGRTFHFSADRRTRHAVKLQMASGGRGVSGLKRRAEKCCEGDDIGGSLWREPALEHVAAGAGEGDLVWPNGFELCESFRLEGTVPVFTYAFADALLEKRVWMKHGQNTVYVTYRLKRAVHAIELRVNALVNHRNHHARTHATRPHFNYSANVGRNGSTVNVLFSAPGGQETTLCMRVSRGRAELTNQWITGFVLAEERARGLPDADDHLHAATFVAHLPPGGQLTFIASAEPTAMSLSLDGETELAMQHAYEKSLLQKFDMARELALERRAEVEGRAGLDSVCVYTGAELSPGTKQRRRRASLEPCIRQLVLAADQFVITRGAGRSVVAGFHWFTDWARDTMIALPGLTIVTGRYDVARSVLLTFSKYVSKGMLPNRFPDDGSAPTEDDYNNADGTLWYFEAIRAYYMATGDLELILELFPVLHNIIAYHCSGTRFGIGEDSDGLLKAGEEGQALTWMDAKTNVVYTPREGKAVELSALWYNALHCMAFFAGELEHEEESDHYTAMADKTERSFQERFWNAEIGYCYDVIDGGKSRTQNNASLRPNQLIAASLNWSPLTSEQRFLVVEACSTYLLTSNSIRTLSPDSKEYKGVYKGDVFSRDSAYHQGVGWTWLLGPFVLAHLRVFGNREEAREFLLPLLRSHLSDAGMGQVSELFDGDAPNRARGCIAQAWSVAELLRAWIATEPDGSLNHAR